MNSVILPIRIKKEANCFASWCFKLIKVFIFGGRPRRVE